VYSPILVPIDDSDTAVMGTHGWRAAPWLAPGSDAETVVRKSDVPVLLVRGLPCDGRPQD
jgi:nucleotide-binding universal stress UspA family protein